jgi:hypothetical protein
MSGTERALGKSGVSVPALGVGTNRWNTGEPGQARLNETLAAAVEVGMGFFDTAGWDQRASRGKGLGVAPVHLMAQASIRIIGMLRPENGKSRQDGAAQRVVCDHRTGRVFHIVSVPLMVTFNSRPDPANIPRPPPSVVVPQRAANAMTCPNRSP